MPLRRVRQRQSVFWLSGHGTADAVAITAPGAVASTAVSDAPAPDPVAVIPLGDDGAIASAHGGAGRRRFRIRVRIRIHIRIRRPLAILNIFRGIGAGCSAFRTAPVSRGAPCGDSTSARSAWQLLAIGRRLCCWAVYRRHAAGRRSGLLASTSSGCRCPAESDKNSMRRGRPRATISVLISSFFSNSNVSSKSIVLIVPFIAVHASHLTFLTRKSQCCKGVYGHSIINSWRACRRAPPFVCLVAGVRDQGKGGHRRLRAQQIAPRLMVWHCGVGPPAPGQACSIAGLVCQQLRVRLRVVRGGGVPLRPRCLPRTLPLPLRQLQVHPTRESHPAAPTKAHALHVSLIVQGQLQAALQTLPREAIWGYRWGQCSLANSARLHPDSYCLR